VVVDHVEDDLDVLDVGARTIALNSATWSPCWLPAAYSLWGAKKRSCCTPVVAQALLQQVAVVTNWWTGISSIAVTPSAVRWSMIAGWAMPA